ncbi:hypothetical protein BDV10DRAFT_199835, partial [Aspergillus recurvatus]
LQAAAENWYSGAKILHLLSDRYSDQIQITESVLKAAAASNGEPRTMALLCDKFSDRIQITEGVLQAAAENWYSGAEILHLLSDRYSDQISITGKLIKAVAKNSAASSETVMLLLQQTRNKGDFQALEEYSWVYQLLNLGYSLRDLAELLLEHHRDSPWLYFDPRNWPHTEIRLNHHVIKCSHSFCHGSMDEASPPSLLVDDNAENLEMVEELYMRDSPGSVDFSEEKQAATISYAQPTDEDEVDIRGITIRHILSALTRLCTAIGLIQEAGLLDHEGPSSCTAELVSVPFDAVVRLNKALESAEDSCSSELMLAAMAVLRLVSLEITNLDLERDMDCLHLCALAVQFLCLGFVSYMQAHTGPIQPFFLDSPLQRIRLVGLGHNPQSSYILAELNNLSCMGDMTGGPVLIFQTNHGLLDRESLQRGEENHPRRYDVLGYLEDVLDTWGPGNFIYRKHARQSPIAVRIGDGILFAHGNGKYHWAKSIDSLQHLRRIDLQQQLSIGYLLSVNDRCNHAEDDCWTRLANAMDTLGTSRSWWDTSQLQAGLQGGQFVLGQLTQTFTKRKGGTVKEVVLARPDEDLIQFMDQYLGIQISYCTRVAKRVRLRTLVADLLPAFSLGRVSDSTLEAIISLLRDEALEYPELDKRLKTISDSSIYIMMGKILRSLEHTGVDRTGRFFCIAWPYNGKTVSCLNIALEGQSSWAKCLADSHCSATFAYITMKCLETDNVRCSGGQKPINDSVYLLETTVSCYPRSNLEQWTLKDREIYFFDKLDTMFWVEVRREDRSRSARLVGLVGLQVISRTWKKRLELREQKRRRNCLREDTMFLQGEPVFISAL